jgi:hypothetical protein
VVDVVVMAYAMVVVASIGTNLIQTTFDGIDFEHFLVALKMGQ